MIHASEELLHFSNHSSIIVHIVHWIFDVFIITIQNIQYANCKL